jgi:hypothetical protein
VERIGVEDEQTRRERYGMDKEREDEQEALDRQEKERTDAIRERQRRLGHIEEESEEAKEE